MNLSFTRWLKRDPKPHKVRLNDGTELVFPKSVGAGSKRVKELSESIEAMAPSTVHALDEDGAITRVWNFDTDEEAAEEKGTKGRLSELAELGRIIAEAGDRAAQRQAGAYQMAFEKQAELLSIVANRLAGLENAWIKTMNTMANERMQFATDIINARSELAAANSANPESQVTEMLGNVLQQSLLPGMKPPAAPTTTNGKAKALWTR